MRTLRRLGAMVVLLLASVVMVLAIVCGLTLVLLPVAIPLGYLSFRLYKTGVKMIIPRGAEVKRRIKKDVARGKRKVRRRLRKRRGLW